MELNTYLPLLKDAVFFAPHKVIKLAAMYLLTEFDRELLPDWVAMLAGGNLDQWEAVIEEVRAGMFEEEYYGYGSTDENE